MESSCFSVVLLVYFLGRWATFISLWFGCFLVMAGAVVKIRDGVRSRNVGVVVVNAVSLDMLKDETRNYRAD